MIEELYKEHLEEDIIKALSKKQKISLEKAMKIYYTSRLADLIHDGEYGVQYLDYRTLVDTLIRDNYK